MIKSMDDLISKAKKIETKTMVVACAEVLPVPPKNMLSAVVGNLEVPVIESSTPTKTPSLNIPVLPLPISLVVVGLRALTVGEIVEETVVPPPPPPPEVPVPPKLAPTCVSPVGDANGEVKSKLLELNLISPLVIIYKTN